MAAEQPPVADARQRETDQPKQATTSAAAREMPCPMCGTPMPDLKGGKDTICPVCGFKDSCCY